MDKPALFKVLADLRANRRTLEANLLEINNTIACLERLYDLPPARAITETAPVVVAPATSVAVANAYRVNNPGNLHDESLESLSQVFKELPGPGLTETIERAAKEARHDQTALTDRVCELRPMSLRTSVQSVVGQLLRKGRIHKGEDLIIRLVVDGKVQGLLPMEPGKVRMQSSLSN